MNDQKAKIAEALRLTESVWKEMLAGNCEEVLQEAVYLQTMVNRIVWKLNDRLNGEDKE